MMFHYDFMSVVMYPDLKNRRHFVHDAWIIAKFTENYELKMAISNDPYFYITRDDIYYLIKTHDDVMIEHMLKIQVALQIMENISYKLVAIKHAQVDAKQQTPVQLVDFISVMVLNKRLDEFDSESEVLFNHNHVMKFLERHKQFVNPEETIKVFIMSRKFRLSIQLLNETGNNFTIEYFTIALESNSYDIAFYLFFQFEADVVEKFQNSIKALVQSYQNSNKLLKAKLHMTKTLLSIFTFTGANELLRELEMRITDNQLENNLFSHTSNPLICMCLLFEFLGLLTLKFFSLNNKCRGLKDQIMKMALKYIDCCDDENFLTSMMLEQDYSGRDCLQITVDLELLEIIQTPKVESIILRIWNSDYDTSGSLLQMSTAYQIVIQDPDINIDIEEKNRFYNVRDISQDAQSAWLFKIFQMSMNARIKAIGLVATLFSLIAISFYTIVVQLLKSKIPLILQRKGIFEKIISLRNDKETI